MKTQFLKLITLMILLMPIASIKAADCSGLGLPNINSIIVFPITPTANQSFFGCFANSGELAPGTGQVESLEIVGNVVKVYIAFNYQYINAPPPDPAYKVVNFPALTAGNYTIHYFVRTTNGPTYYQQFRELTTFQLTIQAAATPTQLPTLSTWGYLLLGLLVLLGMGRRQRQVGGQST